MAMSYRTSFSILLFLIFPVSVSAQSISKLALRQELQHKILFLRGRYMPVIPGQYVAPALERSDVAAMPIDDTRRIAVHFENGAPGYLPYDLNFDAAGHIQTSATEGPLSLSAIYVDRVQLKNNVLTLHAHRIALMRLSDTDEMAVKPWELGDLLQIHVAVNSAQPEALQRALNTIFAANLRQELDGESEQAKAEDLASLPAITPEPEPPQAKNIAKANARPIPFPLAAQQQSAHGIVAPRLLYSVDAVFPQKARQDKETGTCEIRMTIDPEGFPEYLRVVRSLPDGLDEAALAAVSQYRFFPATRNGTPVATQLKVLVNFHLH